MIMEAELGLDDSMFFCFNFNGEDFVWALDFDPDGLELKMMDRWSRDQDMCLFTFQVPHECR